MTDRKFNAAVMQVDRETLVRLCTDYARERVRSLPFARVELDAVAHGHDPISAKLLVVILACTELAKKHGKVAAATRKGESVSMHRAKLSMAMSDAWGNVRDEYVHRRVTHERNCAVLGRPTWRIERGRVVLVHNPAEDPCE